MIRRWLTQTALLVATILLYRRINPKVAAALNPDYARIVAELLAATFSAAIVLIVGGAGLARPRLSLVWWEPGTRTPVSSKEVRLPTGASAGPRQWEVYANYEQSSIFAQLVTAALRLLQVELELRCVARSAVGFAVERDRSDTGITGSSIRVTLPLGRQVPDFDVSELVSSVEHQVAWANIGLEAKTDPGSLKVRLRLELKSTKWSWTSWFVRRCVRITTSVDTVRLERTT